MSLTRFMFTLDGVEQIEAQDRISFVTDMAVVVSGIFGAKGNPVADHIDLLDDVRIGVKLNGDESQ